MLRALLVVLVVAGALAAPVCLDYSTTVLDNNPGLTSGIFCANNSGSCDLRFFARFDDAAFNSPGVGFTSFGTFIESTSVRPGQLSSALQQPPLQQGTFACLESTTSCDPGVTCRVTLQYNYALPDSWTQYDVTVFVTFAYSVSPSLPISCSTYQTWELSATLQIGSLGLITGDSEESYFYDIPPGPSLQTLVEPCLAPLCGNGQVDPGEQCDGGQCCSPEDCQFLGTDNICNAFTGATCVGSTDVCPSPVTNTPTPTTIPSPSSTSSASISPTPSNLPTPSPTPSNTPSISVSPSTTSTTTASSTPSNSPTPSQTPSNSPSTSPTPSPSPGPRCEEVCERYYPL